MDQFTAQYHLPGLFEFYALYRLFLPLFLSTGSIFMTGAALARSTARRRAASGAAGASAAATATRATRLPCCGTTVSPPA